MNWIAQEGSLGICELNDNIYLFVENGDKVAVHCTMMDNGEHIPLIGTYKYKFDDLTKIYSKNSNFFRDLSSMLREVTDVDLDKLRDNIKGAVMDLQYGRVVLDIPRSHGTSEDDDELRYSMDLNAEVSGTLKPTDTKFLPDGNHLILEPCWVPYMDTKTGMHILMPTLLIKTPDGVKITRYMENMFIEKHYISGAFPPSDFSTMITLNGIKRILGTTKEETLPLIAECDKAIDDSLQKHLNMSEIKRILVKRWIEGTYFFQVTNTYPIINICGPSESGKSRLGLCLTAMSYHGEPTLDLTEAGIFRAKEELKPTIVVDEAEYLGDEDSNKRIKLLINASYSEGLGYVHRYDEIGGARVRVKFNLYSPMAIIAISPLTGITASRSIAISMRRTDKDMPKAYPWMYQELRDKMYALKFFLSYEVWEIYQALDISEYVTSRFDELFRPLFTLTKLFGTDEEFKLIGEWATQYQKDFRASAINITKHRDVLLMLHKMLLDPTKHRMIGSDEWVFLKELAAEVQVTIGGKWTSHTVGSVLRSLGFTGRKQASGSQGGGYTLAQVPLKSVEAVMKNYSILYADDEDE